jgi:hypothetical protein
MTAEPSGAKAMSNQDDNKQHLAGQGGGRNRQGIGEAFMMSMIRQIARSIGTLLVRMFTGGRR